MWRSSPHAEGDSVLYQEDNLVSFYTPHGRLQALGGIHHDPLPRPNLTQGVGGWQGGGDEKSLERAHELFDKGWKALKERDFANAINCLSHALKIRVLHYGVLAPECASTFYGYGRALLSKAFEVTNPWGNASKNAPNKESVESTATTSKNAASGSLKICSNTEHVLPLENGDSEGKYLNERDQGDEKMTGNEDSDLDLAWKMLNIARATVAKIPDKTMEKANIFYALAEVSMKRDDRGNSLGYYIKALTILEYLVRPDHLGIVYLNFRICLAFELASKVGDAIPYCAKAISVCKSRIHNLKNAKEDLFADNDVCTSAAEGRSGNFTPEDEISSLARLLVRLQNKLGELEQATSTPSTGIDNIVKRVVSQASDGQNVSCAVARTAASM